MRQMIPVDISRVLAFCKTRGGQTSVARTIGISHSAIHKMEPRGTVSLLVLERIQEAYGIPYRLFLPRTPPEEFLGWMSANPPPKPKREPKPKLCNARCKECRYGSGDIFGPTPACLYILRTGTSRPCPPGAECTEFTKGECREYVSTRIL